MSRGQYYRHNKKALHEDCAHFNVFDLKRAGAFKTTEAHGTIRVSRSLTFPFAIRLPLMLVHYQGKNVSILLEATRPHFGGKRWWFRCPACDRRCGVLYVKDGIACRECFDLTYELRVKPWLAFDNIMQGWGADSDI